MANVDTSLFFRYSSRMSSPVSYDLQGQGGGIVVSLGATSVTGNFRWIQIVEDTVLSTLTSSNIDGAADLTGITLPAGLGIGGRFSNIVLTSGTAIAYYA